MAGGLAIHSICNCRMTHLLSHDPGTHQPHGKAVWVVYYFVDPFESKLEPREISENYNIPFPVSLKVQ